MMARDFAAPRGWDGRPWVTYIKGSEGRAWCDEVSDVLLWRDRGLELATYRRTIVSVAERLGTSSVA